MVVAEVTIIPLVAESIRPYIQMAVAALEESGLRYEVGAMGTAIEGELDEVLEAIKGAHRRVLEAGAGRVLTEIRIDERKGGLTIDGKLRGFPRTK